MLACSCPTISDWWFQSPNDFETLDCKRRKRCCSCKDLIDTGTVCVKFYRYREPLSDVEECIHRDEIPLAAWYMCEECGEIFFNLESIGYCFLLGASMREALEEYQKSTGFKKG